MEDITRCRLHYRCHMRSVPGPYTQYDGYVDVWCDGDCWSDVFDEAVRELQRTAFADRAAAQWRLLNIKRID
jgi:hypothetical protein